MESLKESYRVLQLLFNEVGLIETAPMLYGKYLIQYLQILLSAEHFWIARDEKEQQQRIKFL